MLSGAAAVRTFRRARPGQLLARLEGRVSTCGRLSQALIADPLLVVVFYFLLIRPQRKRQQERSDAELAWRPGQVMTTTGLFATVVAIDDEDVDPGDRARRRDPLGQGRDRPRTSTPVTTRAEDEVDERRRSTGRQRDGRP